jgi:hypothetical protein
VLAPEIIGRCMGCCINRAGNLRGTGAVSTVVHPGLAGGLFLSFGREGSVGTCAVGSMAESERIGMGDNPVRLGGGVLLYPGTLWCTGWLSIGFRGGFVVKDFGPLWGAACVGVFGQCCPAREAMSSCFGGLAVVARLVRPVKGALRRSWRGWGRGRCCNCLSGGLKRGLLVGL